LLPINQIKAAATSHSRIINIICSIIVIAGLIVAIMAGRIIGKNWSSNIDIKKDNHLISSGVYKYVRHSIYS